MRVTCLVEDRAQDGLRGEHGLSLFIEAGTKILFDTGQSSLFAENAAKLGLDPGDVDAAIISHGHYDHGGGLGHFLKVNSKAYVFMGKEVFRRRYAVEDGNRRFIGLGEIESPRIRFIDRQRKISPGYTILKGFKGYFRKPEGNRTLFMESGSCLVPDTFSDELVLVIEEHERVNVITGCSHNGILNILATVREHFPGKGIGLVAGGLHISGDAGYVASGLQEFGVGELYTGHCTSEEALKVLKEKLDCVRDLRTGTVIKIR